LKLRSSGFVGIAADQLGNFQVRAADGGRGRSRLVQKLADVGAGQADSVFAPFINDGLARARQSP
jgi:hypothetical protein